MNLTKNGLKRTGIAWTLTLCVASSLAFASTTPVFASEEGHRNTAVGLGVASAALLLTQKNKLPGIVLGAGAAYAEYEHVRATDRRHRDEGNWDRGYDRRDDSYRREQNREAELRRERERQERIREAELRREREDRARRERRDRQEHHHDYRDRHDDGHYDDRH